LDHKTNNLENLHKLCLQEFPEYKREIHHLLLQHDFLEMLEEYAYCQNALMNQNQITMNRAVFEQLMMELKQEMNLFILKHINQLD